MPEAETTFEKWMVLDETHKETAVRSKTPKLYSKFGIAH